MFSYLGQEAEPNHDRGNGGGLCDTIHRIRQLAGKLGLERHGGKPYRGKLEEYVKRNHPRHHQALVKGRIFIAPKDSDDHQR